MHKHILGVVPFEDKLNLISADVNNDGEINGMDLVDLRKLILSLTDRFPNNSSYKYIPQALQSIYVPGMLSPLLDTLILHGQIVYDFTGIKIGDIFN